MRLTDATPAVDGSHERRPRAGWFRFRFDDERWEWSPEVQALHGYQPGTVTPTTDLVLSHKHPEDREHVEQAKGMLMVVYGIDAEAAFELLRWRSQEANIKLRSIADQVVRDFVDLAQREQAPTRAVYDNLLLTGDRRVGES